jgi:hypothetical protein
MSTPSPTNLPAINRYITTHNSDGKAILAKDIPSEPTWQPIPIGANFFLVYTTRGFPISMKEEEVPGQPKPVPADIKSYLGDLASPPSLTMENGGLISWFAFLSSLLLVETVLLHCFACIFASFSSIRFTTAELHWCLGLCSFSKTMESAPSKEKYLSVVESRLKKEGQFDHLNSDIACQPQNLNTDTQTKEDNPANAQPQEPYAASLISGPRPPQ